MPGTADIVGYEIDLIKNIVTFHILGEMIDYVISAIGITNNLVTEF